MVELFRALGYRRISVSTLLALAAGVSKAGVVALTLAAIHDPSPARIGGLVGLVVIVAIFEMLSIRVLALAGEDITLRLRTDLLRAMGSTDLRGLEETGLARLLDFVGRDASTLSFGIASAPVVLMNLLLVVAVLVYLFTINWVVGLIFIGGVLVGAVAIRIIDGGYLRHLAVSNEAQVRASELFSLQVRAAASLKLSEARRRAVESDTEETWNDSHRARVAARALWATTQGATTLVIFLLIALVLGLRGPLGLQNEELVSFGFIAIFFGGPVGMVMGGMHNIGEARASFSRLASTLADLRLEAPSSGESAVPMRSLELVDVEFAYDSFAIGPVSIEITAGETVFIVGGNGSGKSTLLHVLMGLYPLTRGEIRTDGVPVPFPSTAHRERFAFVPFEFVLFERVYGRTEDDIASDLGLFQMSEKVGVDNGEWTTTQLSQGQRRRLALVDAVTEKKEVLVLDECAADQDPEFREHFYRTILPRLRARGQTLIVVSHDDRYFDLADRIIELERGRVVPPKHRGNTAELC